MSLRQGVTLALLTTAFVVLAMVYSISRVDAPTVSDVSERSEGADDTEVLADNDKKTIINNEAIQLVVNDWAKSQQGDVSVYITDHEGVEVASVNPDEQYFSASIYKLYVAYVGYVLLDEGVFMGETAYANGWSLEKCLDEMIRSSDSPCAETMLNEISRQKLQEYVDGYGFTNTSIAGFLTTAHDATKLLVRISSHKDLSQSSDAKLLASMEEQQYRQALAKGFGLSRTYNKVGFNYDKEYHDVGIVELPNDTTLIISVFTIGVGNVEIAELANSIENVVLQDVE